MKRRLDKARWRVASPLLDELLSLDASGRAERLAQLRQKDCALADDLTYLLEQYEDNRLIRPRADYKGPRNKTYAPLEKR